MDNGCNSRCSKQVYWLGLMRIWLKSTAARMSRPALWMTGSVFLVLLALNGLDVIAPLNCKPPQAGFFAGLFLLTLFWIGWVTFFASLVCWINAKFFS